MKKDQLFEKIKQGHPRGSWHICLDCEEVLSEGQRYCPLCKSRRILKWTTI